MKIDFHTHCFPDALAERAMATLVAHDSAEMPVVAHTNGTANGAKTLLQGVGINRAVVCNIATNARQESKVNSFAISLAEQKDFFFSLGSVHPDSEQKEAELDRLAAAGIRGIKLHPDYVGMLITDSRFDVIFSMLEERGMFAIVHAGLDPISPNLIHATPQMLAEVLHRHPSLKLVAAHMGGFRLSEDVLRYLVGSDIYLDTSLSSLRAAERENLIKILKEHREDRLLFGTDTPWSDPTAEIAFLENAGLCERRKEKIYCQNATELLGI